MAQKEGSNTNSLPGSNKNRKISKINDVYSKQNYDKYIMSGCINQPSRIRTLAQVNWNERNKVKEELKAMLPMLSPAEVRRHRIPYHEAIILELEEDGLQDAVEYIKNLFKIDEEMRNIASHNKDESEKPYLKNQKDLLDSLRNALTAAEKSKISEETDSQAMAFLRVAIFFQSQKSEWWWVAQRLFKSALTVAESNPEIDKYTITIVRYLYGRFLCIQMQELEEALQQLNAARETSKGKIWNASEILGKKQETVYKECNILLHKTLLVTAQCIEQENPGLAVEACEEALKRANDSEHNEYIMEALHALGKSTLRTNNVKQALQHFYKLLAIAKRIPDTEQICSTYMELAYAYKELGDSAGTEKYLRLFQQSAEEFHLIQKLSQSHYFTGEHFLSKGRPDLATPHFEKALELYNDPALKKEATQSRIMAGISKGQKVIHKYIDLIIQSCENDRLAILKICRWKSFRDAFWTHSIKDYECDESGGDPEDPY